MTKAYLIGHSIFHSVGVLLYVVLVGWIMQNGERYFGQMNDLWGPAAFLMLFVVSALIVGFLVLGHPVYLYLEGKKTDSYKMFFYTAGFLVLEIVLIFVILIARA